MRTITLPNADPNHEHAPYVMVSAKERLAKITENCDQKSVLKQ
jgi:hypothetical protein